jgi:hypothetical protein
MEDKYLFHQTPYECAKDLLQYIHLEHGDKVVEPFKGEGSFYNQFPNYVIKDYAESSGLKFESIDGEFTVQNLIQHYISKS